MSKFSKTKSKKSSPVWQMSLLDFQNLVDNSNSYIQILEYFGLKSKGGNNHTLSKRIKQDNINLEKLNANRILFKKNNNRKYKKRNLESVLIENSNYNRGLLKKRLIKEKLLEYKCNICGLLPEWNGQKLSLQIDHINGINNDNRLDNLQFICPNCHSQTPTYAGKKHKKPKRPLLSELNPDWNKQPKFNMRKVERPTWEELQKMLWEKPTMQIAKEYGVSDSAVAKWAKWYKISKPPRGYWTKLKFKK